MANEVKKANREQVRKAILARKAARKTETAAQYEKMRACAKAPAKFAGILNVLVAKSARQADYMDGLRENLGLVKAAAEAPAKVRVAAARNYGKDFIKIAEEKPNMLADALRDAYKGLDEQAAAMEIAAEALGIDLGATPAEKAFSDEGKAELETGESEGEAGIPDFESEEAPAEKKAPDFGKKDEKPAEKKEEPKEDKKEESEKEEKPAEEKEAAVGSDAYTTDRDSSGSPKLPAKAKIPQAQGEAAKLSSKKTAMSKRDYILLADAIKDSQLSDLDKEAFARHLSGYLKRDNGAFLEERFVDYTLGRGGPSGGRAKTAPKPRPTKTTAPVSTPSAQTVGETA